MSTLLQDVIVSLVAMGAVTAIGVRARAMFGSKPSGAACGSCTKCPATHSTLPAAVGRAFSPADAQEPQPRVIRLTVIPASSPRSQQRA